MLAFLDGIIIDINMSAMPEYLHFLAKAFRATRRRGCRFCTYTNFKNFGFIIRYSTSHVMLDVFISLRKTFDCCFAD